MTPPDSTSPETGEDYFLCGVGGSGMLPLALILRARGARVEGSDRALDQGRTATKFDFLRREGVRLHRQDGSGVVSPGQIVVASAAVEASVPDIARAIELGCPRLTRAELLARLFNAAPRSVGVAGTSGKSTTTAMIAWMLHRLGADPTVMNGAVMKNFLTPDAPFASSLVGRGDVFVSEIDESDGSIAGYTPLVAVVNNIALDHKPMEELRGLFGGFLTRAKRSVLNLDNDETRALLPLASRPLTYSLSDEQADLVARDVQPRPDGISALIHCRGNDETTPLTLSTPGRHNVSNALAAIGAVMSLGWRASRAVEALNGFAGVRRRLELVGEAAGVVVYDDFAHNPDKIAASLATLRESPGRLLVMFQPHGFAPMRLMRDGLVRAFADGLAPEDALFMPEPVYFGGTVDRSPVSGDICAGVAAAGRKASAHADRAAAGEALLSVLRTGDRVIVMGARDDTLSEFAADLLARAPQAVTGS